MIPVKLQISNFTSYGQTPKELDFTKFKLAAISGLNGAGKSSLLDAVTWCVWGSSRAGDSSDSLIHSGATEMFAEFSFELDGQVFTIKRQRLQKSGGSTNLEFWSGSHNLTEGTIKATQEKIITTLHLSFETFTNSSYLRQGHADEFTTKGPTDRKRILADILGLDHYDRLEEKAKEKSKEAQSKLQLLDYQLLELEAELSQKEEREKSLSLVQEEAEKVEKELSEVEKLIKEIDNEKQTILQTIKSFEEKRLQVEQAKKELLNLKEQLQVKEKSKEEFLSILEKKEDIEKNYQELQMLNRKSKGLESTRSELIKIKDEFASVQKTLHSREEKRAEAIKQLEIETKKFQTEKAQLENQISHLENHKTTCPTCGQTIDEAKNKEIILENKKKALEYQKQIQDLEEKVKKYKEIVLPEKKQCEILEQEIKKLEYESKEWFEINTKITTLEVYSDLFTKIQQAETGSKTLGDAILDLQKIYQTRQDWIIEAEKGLEGFIIFETKLQEIKTNLVAKENTKLDLAKKALELRGQVGEAKQLVSRTSQLENLQKEKKAEKDKQQKEKEIFEELALAFGKKGIQAMIIEAAIPEIEGEANNLLGKLSDGRMMITLKTQKETKTKMSDGERGIVETLDIIISDEMGERPYEMYSGGEAFRVNFAIRLAISKLLTQRAGARLQFLVIDEGFGSQDAPGRARLVEAIDAIKNDFEKILVITHIEELKEEFPVRIEVSKNTTGSTFELIGD